MNQTIQQKLALLPDRPGVYLMRNAEGQIIYVGKARVLKNRVRQYFHLSGLKPVKVRNMVDQIADFDYIITPSESNALLLEATLIKKHKPKYNILLKDDKNFPFLRIDLKEPFPRVTVVRRMKRDGAKYFGPFLNGVPVKELLEIVHLAYPVRSCSGNPEKAHSRRGCLNRFLGRCLAPCMGGVSEEEYRRIIDQVMRFLKGDTEAVEKILFDRMMRCSENEEFEQALVYRNRLDILKKLSERKVVSLTRHLDLDVFAVATNGVYGVVSALFVRDGKIFGARNVESRAEGSEGEFFRNFVYAYYARSPVFPDEILCNLPDEEELGEYFRTEYGEHVTVFCPKLGVKRELVKMAESNAREYLAKNVEQIERRELLYEGAAEELTRVIGLPHYARRMECYDISNISGVDKTASMVVTLDGKPARSMYRRFRIRTVEGSNDFESLKETLSRRMARLAEGTDESFAERPDLIIIDGGKGQLSSVMEVMESLGSDIPVVSLAKREEEIFLPHRSEPLVLPKSSIVLRLFQRIRDEAHRFAITYHRALRGKRYDSQLEQIPGIGRTRRIALAGRFPTPDDLRNASVEEIAAVPEIGPKIARNIFDFFHKCDTIESDNKENANEVQTGGE